VLHTTSPSTTIKEKLQALLYETTTATTPHHGMCERRAQESAAAAAAMKLVLKMRREKERKTNEKVEAQRKKLAEQIKKFWPQWSSPDEESKAAEKIFRF
jgi:cysteine sulfinate desulfinase/cysteine desulfurase-like protein